jgi:hypothetical protein
MRRAAPWSLVIVIALYGCSTMNPRGTDHPGITEMNPNAVTREFPATSTQVAQIMAEVMTKDSILDQVSILADKQSKEFRNFTKAERQALGISLLTPANDVNFNLTARSKNGHPVTVAVRLKGQSGSEVSVLYGASGDTALSKDLLDKAEATLAKAAVDPNLAKTAGSKTASSNTRTR